MASNNSMTTAQMNHNTGATQPNTGASHGVATVSNSSAHAIMALIGSSHAGSTHRLSHAGMGHWLMVCKPPTAWSDEPASQLASDAVTAMVKVHNKATKPVPAHTNDFMFGLPFSSASAALSGNYLPDLSAELFSGGRCLPAFA